VKNLGLELADKVFLYHDHHDSGLWVSIINLASQIRIESEDYILRDRVMNQVDETSMGTYGDQRDL
jgi:hypothetical protein